MTGRTQQKAWTRRQLQDYREVLDWFDIDAMLRTTILTTLLFVCCWWGFALYIDVRREYFLRP